MAYIHVFIYPLQSLLIQVCVYYYTVCSFTILYLLLICVCEISQVLYFYFYIYSTFAMTKIRDEAVDAAVLRHVLSLLCVFISVIE